jgi:Baseplate J-like protein
MTAPDRLDALLAQSAITGIDFVAVSATQTELDVYFHVPPPAQLVATLTSDDVRIAGAAPGVADVPVAAIAWATTPAPDNRPILRVTVASPGGWEPYELALSDPRIDPFYARADVDFKATCLSDLDCATPEHVCPTEEQADVVVDTSARDFWSFRRALFDFASQRYPHWQDRLEADVGVMLVEVYAALADELAYSQDRFAREGWLETATQRRSVRRLARLVDYPMHDGRGATGWLEVTVETGAIATLLRGDRVYAETDVVVSDDGRPRLDANGAPIHKRLPFEIGLGLHDDGLPFHLVASVNSISAHVWDETEICLPAGSTELTITGWHASELALNDTPPAPPDDPSNTPPPGRWVLLRTDPTDPSLPARRHLVRLVSVEEDTDPLGAALGIASKITRVRWEEAQATPFDMDLMSLTLRGNLVPITAGRTETAHFSIGPNTHDVARAIERRGPNGSIAYLFTLPDADDDGLVWHGRSPESATPELLVHEAKLNGVWTLGDEWNWRRSLLGTESSKPEDRHVTLDDGTWGPAVTYRRISGDVVHEDYLRADGVTLRFGDGEFGRLPPRGDANTGERFFEVTYRLGNGAVYNVPADAITGFDALPSVTAVSNPLPTSGGVEPESLADVKKRAPEAFRALTYRAVRPEDYAEAAERLTWVQRAGATFRWTGSWLTAFVTADPRDASSLDAVQRQKLEAQIDRFRQAGREAHALDPRYADLDVEVKVCVAPHAYREHVRVAVEEALLAGPRSARRARAFFHPDRFTFGTPLDRSALEARIQAVPGVRAVESVRLRRRGRFDWKPFNTLAWTPATDEVIRVDGDPTHPTRGSLLILMEGGA